MSETLERIRPYREDFLSLPQSTHVCLIYNTEQERRTSVSQYVESALAKRDKFLYVTDTETESVLEWLKPTDPAKPGHSEQFVLAVAKEVYCPCGHFVPKDMLNTLEEFNQTTKKQGYRGFSGTGEMAWATRGWPGSEKLIDYESQLNELVVKHALTLLCQYDMNRFDGGIILDVLRVHPKVLVSGQVLENPFYKQASAERHEGATSLEPSSRVLSELMLVQGLVYAFPTERKVGEFVCKALERIPGCDACVIEIEDYSSLATVEAGTNFPRYTERLSSSESASEKVVFPLATSKRLYGNLTLNVYDHSLFKPYRPHIHNVVNSIAITFENRWQQREINSEIERHKRTTNELQQTNGKLSEMANTDPLTGLYNRRHFFQKAPEEVIRSLRQGQDIVLIAFDFNSFKNVNDTFGHDEGNRLLRDFAVITKAALREAIDFVFRFGGDEFVVLMGDCNEEKAKAVCHRLNEKFCEMTDIASLSYGIVEVPKSIVKSDVAENDKWLEALLKIADQRMYQFKSSVKGR
jgi:diguanylate cyclase (GGDEF)-like protein